MLCFLHSGFLREPAQDSTVKKGRLLFLKIGIRGKQLSCGAMLPVGKLGNPVQEGTNNAPTSLQLYVCLTTLYLSTARARPLGATSQMDLVSTMWRLRNSETLKCMKA
ncbi:hypothetical protein TRVL_07138 [Trypanosoma vivax]|nr:hypothetical protein TRVL_07138 [Trypanosoma vivax]